MKEGIIIALESGKWMGKSWGTLGDSITSANGYQPLVSKQLGFSRVVNYGKSGCTMTAGGQRDDGATVNVGRQIDPTLDCVTIFAGTNDFRLGKPLGDINNRDVFTFCGAYATLIEDILTKNPGCRLSLWTPLQRDKDGYNIHFSNDAGHRLIDYAQQIQAVGVAYALPVLNLFAESGLNQLTLPLYTSDGLHPNALGYQRIAGMVTSFLTQL
ncbi:MAG: lysophospholipase L1-like esterase [Bacilli bacterium]|nr:lysophospholipase L1-like esterase [Bacilli bacterium]